MSGVSLRRRFTRNFAVLALVVASLFAALTYVGVRHIVVTSRQSSDLQQAYVNVHSRWCVGRAVGSLVARYRHVVHFLRTYRIHVVRRKR
jgi:hypothetical protein